MRFNIVKSQAYDPNSYNAASKLRDEVQHFNSYFENEVINNIFMSKDVESYEVHSCLESGHGQVVVLNLGEI